MSETYPVTVAVKQQNGIAQVRVGTATRTADGFALKLGELSIGATPVPAQASGGSGGGSGGAVFPNYGRSKNQPIAGASMQDLEYYANGCRRSLDDPSKERWHDKERSLLALIEAEIAMQGGGSVPPKREEPPAYGDDDIPF